MLDHVPAGHGLVPAGSIDEVVSSGPFLVLAEDHLAVYEYAADTRDSKFPEAKLVRGAPADKVLVGKSLIVYATPEHPFMRAHWAALPFRYGDGTLDIDGRHFEGSHLRLIAAITSPVDLDRWAVLYVAARPEDLVGIDAVECGPAEWVVADGDTMLGSGVFLANVELQPVAMQSDLDRLSRRSLRCT